jgi:hypothetical protein
MAPSSWKPLDEEGRKVTEPTNVRDEAIALHIAADELAFDAKWHTSLFPRDEWTTIKRRLRERLRALSLRADRLRDALDDQHEPKVQPRIVPLYLRWLPHAWIPDSWLRQSQINEPEQEVIHTQWLRDLYRRTRILLSTAHEYIEPNGMGTRH